MRKSNWIIAAVLLLASVAFLWIWHALQFDLVDNPLDIVVTVVWWVVIAAACVAIHWAEKEAPGTDPHNLRCAGAALQQRDGSGASEPR